MKQVRLKKYFGPLYPFLSLQKRLHTGAPHNSTANLQSLFSCCLGLCRPVSFPSISYYFYIPKNFDYLEFHCPTEEKIGIDEKVICYHNISNLLWKKDVLSAWKKKGISKTLQILGLTASNLQTFFSIHFFSSH